MIPAPLQSSAASASRSRSQPSKSRERPSSGRTGTVETHTMKLRESGGAALRVRTFDTPQQAAAAITRTKASTGPLAPSSTAATPMPARATAIPNTRVLPGRSPSTSAAKSAVKTACTWRTREESPAPIPRSMPMKSRPNLATPSASPTPTIHFHATFGLPTKKTAGRAATRKRRAEKSSGGKWSSPSSMTTKLTPQRAVTRTARAMWRGRMLRGSRAWTM